MEYEGKKFPTVEHAFQAAKCVNDAEKEKIRRARSPTEAKKVGQTVQLRSDWESQKVNLMEEILRIKFSHSKMRDLLDQTKDSELIEGNTWHDNYWGDCICEQHKSVEGVNVLGKLLMKIRDT